MLPEIEKNGKKVRQSMLDFKRSPTKTELNSTEIYGGLPLKDERRKNLKTYGLSLGEFTGLMDNYSLCRVKQDSFYRNSNTPDRVWFRLDNAFADINKVVCVNKPTPVKSFCAYDRNSASATFSWYVIAKSLVGKYPDWANQYDLWQPNISEDLKADWFALCYAFGLTENRCVVTKFEKDNPVVGAPEVWVDNPMSPNNQECFYRTTLQKEIKKSKTVANDLAITIEAFYQYWNLNYTKGQILENVGLHDEAYFKYFDYPDFLTKDSGLIQIKKYADLNDCADLLEKITLITAKTKVVKEEIYRMLIEDFKYFE
jgi:hypothetical protein